VTAAVAAVRVGAERLRVAVSVDALALSGLGLLALGLLAAVWGTWGDLDSDTGYDVVAGARIADGEVPYRDFTYFYGPLAPGLAALGALAGGGFGPAILVGLVVTAAIVLATYALARSFVGPLGAFLASAMTLAVALVPNNYSYVLPHTSAATLGTLGLLCFLLGLARFQKTRQEAWLAAAGVAAGLVFLTKPEPAAAVVVAGALFLLVRRRARYAALLAAPAAAIPAVVYGAFLAVVSPHTLLFENLYPVDELDAGGDVLVRARMPMTLESVVEVGGKALLYAAGAAVLVLAARLLTKRSLRVRSALLIALGVLGALAALAVNPEALRHGFYYVYGWIPAGAAFALVWLLYRHRGRERPLELAGVGALVVVAATTYGGFLFHAPRPQMAVYYAPLVAIFLVSLHLKELGRARWAVALGAAWLTFLATAGAGLAIKDARVESTTVRGPGGALAETPAEAGLYQAALEQIAARTSPGDRILVGPLLTNLYVLSDRRSPLPELSLLPGALPTEADERSAIARLDRADVQLVVTDRREWPGYGHGAFGETFDRVLAAWLTRNFNHAATLEAGGDESRTLDVWRRRVS
jgi:hypothetical protein